MKSKAAALRISVFAAVVILSLLAGACGTPPAAPSTAAPQPQPAGPSGEIAVGVAADPVSMDPRVCIAQSGFAMERHVFEPLVFRDDAQNLTPVLAESWSRPDPKTWEFKLRRGVKFHNGEAFDAESVKYTIESLLNPNNKWINTQISGYISPIASVEIKDPYTVQLHTKTPSNALVHNLALIDMLPPKHSAAVGDKFTTQPFGSGPYKILEYVSNSKMVIEAFDDYWGTKPKLKKITFRILPENATRVAALESGEVQLINNLPVDAIARVKGNPALQVLSIGSNRVIHLGLLNDRKPFNDLKVRQAINYAVDKEALIKDLLGGLAEVTKGPMHPMVPGFKDNLSPYTYNPQKAKDLLAQAGYPDGLKIKFGYPTGRYLMDKQVGEAIVGQLGKAGFIVEPSTAEWGTFFNNRGEGKYDAYLYGFGAVTMNPDYALQWFSRGRQWGGNYKNDQVDKLLTDADAEPDWNKALDMYKQANQIIWDDAVWGFLYYQPDVYGASKSLQGFKPRVDEYFLLWNASLAK